MRRKCVTKKMEQDLENLPPQFLDSILYQGIARLVPSKYDVTSVYLYCVCVRFKYCFTVSHESSHTGTVATVLCIIYYTMKNLLPLEYSAQVYSRLSSSKHFVQTILYSNCTVGWCLQYFLKRTHGHILLQSPGGIVRAWAQHRLRDVTADLHSRTPASHRNAVAPST